MNNFKWFLNTILVVCLWFTILHLLYSCRPYENQCNCNCATNVCEAEVQLKDDIFYCIKDDGFLQDCMDSAFKPYCYEYTVE